MLWEGTIGVRIEALTEETLVCAPEWGRGGCGWCLYWQEPSFGELSREEAFARKRAWLRRVLSEWGNCGKILFSHGEPVGYAQYAPARFFPTTAEYPAGPVSGDAVFLACLFISAEKQRRRGLGSALLCAILKELRVRGLGAVETFARKGNPENPSGPVEFYLKHGFRAIREDPEFPLLRLELR